MTITEISDQIQNAPFGHTPIMIAIEGFGGAGKTTFAANLKDVLGDAYVVHIDDFFLPDKKSDAHKSNFDRKRLEEQVLLPLRNGQSAAYQKINDDTNTLSEFIPVPNVTYVIIEGVSTFHPSIASYMDYKIWLSTPKDVAKVRGAKRDGAEDEVDKELWEHWTDTYQEYKDLYRPESLADFVFDTNTQDG